MTRFFPLLAAFLLAGAAFAQDAPATDASEMMEMDAMADTVDVVTFDPEASRALSMGGDSLFKASAYQMALDTYSEGYGLDSTYAKNPFGQARSYVRLNNLRLR